VNTSQVKPDPQGFPLKTLETAEAELTTGLAHAKSTVTDNEIYTP